MYQQYRNKKKSSGKGAKFLAIVIAIVVLGGGIWYLSKLGAKVETIVPTTTEYTGTSISDGRYIGKQVSLEGDISASSNPLVYSHILTLSGGETIELMSSKVNLNNSQGHVYAQGEVAKYDGKKFIVDISAIGTTPDQLSSMTLPISTNSKTFPNLALKLDMTNHSDISYASSGDKILVHVEGFSDTMTIQGFRCETGFPERDCDQIQKAFSGGSFVNAGGMAFTQGANNQWFARNSAGVGYRITSPSDALVYKASSILVPLNEGYIKSLVPSMEKLCNIKSAGQPTIQKETTTSWNAQIKNSAGATCNVHISFTEAGDEISVGNQSAGQTTTGTKTPGTSTSTPSTTKPTASTGAAPALSASGAYTYTSTRGGYSITFPSAKISYYGINIQEDLGIDKLNCYIRLDIKDYKDKDADSVGPAVSIYECTSKESSATLTSKSAGYIFKTNKDGSKLFFIQTVNPAWNEFAKKISIQ